MTVPERTRGLLLRRPGSQTHGHRPVGGCGRFTRLTQWGCQGTSPAGSRRVGPVTRPTGDSVLLSLSLVVLVSLVVTGLYTLLRPPSSLDFHSFP